MPLPEFNLDGDMPPGVYRASLDEVTARFGGGSNERIRCTRNLTHIHKLIHRTGLLRRFVIFGSYVTSKKDPNDVDVIVVMDDSFHPQDAAAEIRGLFDHAVAQARFGASIFWIQPSIVLLETVDRFIDHWQVKRDGTRRGIVEITP
jgi:predicted nucleotidyltransferase